MPKTEDAGGRPDRLGLDRLSLDLLAQAWADLGADAGLLDLVSITGDPAGLLPSRLPAYEAMTASVAAATLAVSALDAARRGRAPAPAFLGAHHVAVAATSERYASRPGSDLSIGFAPLSRFWRAADGWIRLHANYPWHQERAVAVLGGDPAADAVATAIAGWQAQELEEALAAAGALGFAVRDLGAWRRHPQGAALAAAPLIERGTASRPGRKARSGRWLEGFRVLDLTRVIAGPVATRTLAAWGADVLRIDSPRLPEIPAQLIDTLPGKRSALADFAEPAGRARLEELLAQADVLVQGYRPGALALYGLAEDDLAQRHPQLSVVTLSAWGSAGPWADRRGFDSLVQGPTGIAAIEGQDGRPGALPGQVLDHATGYLAAAAATLSLAGVVRGEGARSQRLSLARTARWLTDVPARERAAARPLEPGGYLATIAGPGHAVRVIRPPGRAGEREPRWDRTTGYGDDAAAFGGAG